MLGCAGMLCLAVPGSGGAGVRLAERGLAGLFRLLSVMDTRVARIGSDPRVGGGGAGGAKRSSKSVMNGGPAGPVQPVHRPEPCLTSNLINETGFFMIIN